MLDLAEGARLSDGGKDGEGGVEGGALEEGVLVPLKTTLEVGARERTVEVWVTIVDVKMAGTALE